MQVDKMCIESYEYDLNIALSVSLNEETKYNRKTTFQPSHFFHCSGTHSHGTHWTEWGDQKGARGFPLTSTPLHQYTSDPGP